MRITTEKDSPGSDGETLANLEAKFSADSVRAEELLERMLDLRYPSVEVFALHFLHEHEKDSYRSEV